MRNIDLTGTLDVVKIDEMRKIHFSHEELAIE